MQPFRFNIFGSALLYTFRAFDHDDLGAGRGPRTCWPKGNTVAEEGLANDIWLWSKKKTPVGIFPFTTRLFWVPFLDYGVNVHSSRSF